MFQPLSYPRWLSPCGVALCTLTLALSTVGTVSAQTPNAANATNTNTNTASAGPVALPDRAFMENAAQSGLAEVALGKLAQERGSSAKVKAFGERMQQDHAKANDELMTLARSKNVSLPAAAGRVQQSEAERLAALSGAEFDRAYMSHMVDHHQKDVEAFQTAARTAKDSDLKAFATRNLPTLQTHLQHAQSLYGEVRKAGGGKGGNAGSEKASGKGAR